MVLLLLTFALAGCSNAAVNSNHAGPQLREQGRLQEAVAEYDEAIRLDPQDAQAYNNRGSFQWSLCTNGLQRIAPLSERLLARGRDRGPNPLYICKRELHVELSGLTSAEAPKSLDTTF